MTEQRFFQTLKAVPEGYFTSYGQLAKLSGVHVRQILAWLRALPEDSALPWHRVINAQRMLSQHNKTSVQQELLAREGLEPNACGRYPQERQWPAN